VVFRLGFYHSRFESSNPCWGPTADGFFRIIMMAAGNSKISKNWNNNKFTAVKSSQVVGLRTRVASNNRLMNQESLPNP
jgi:hypothetical protein